MIFENGKQVYDIFNGDIFEVDGEHSGEEFICVSSMQSNNGNFRAKDREDRLFWFNTITDAIYILERQRNALRSESRKLKIKEDKVKYYHYGLSPESRRKEVADRFGNVFTPDDHMITCKDGKVLNVQIGKKYKCTAFNGQRIEVVDIEDTFDDGTAMLDVAWRNNRYAVGSDQIYESKLHEKDVEIKENIYDTDTEDALLDLGFDYMGYKENGNDLLYKEYTKLGVGYYYVYVNCKTGKVEILDKYQHGVSKDIPDDLKYIASPEDADRLDSYCRDVLLNPVKKESYKRLHEQDVEIEVKHEGILEVPEGKNVDDLPISHFEKLAKKKGLGKITKALNNLQVWNKNDDPKLSKWAGDMIDKLNKKLKKDESLNRSLTEGTYIEKRLLKYIPKKLQPYVVWLDYEPSSHVYFLTFEKDGVEYSPDPADDVSELAWNARQYTDILLGRKKESISRKKRGLREKWYNVDGYSFEEQDLWNRYNSWLLSPQSNEIIDIYNNNGGIFDDFAIDALYSDFSVLDVLAMGFCNDDLSIDEMIKSLKMMHLIKEAAPRKRSRSVRQSGGKSNSVGKFLDTQIDNGNIDEKQVTVVFDKNNNIMWLGKAGHYPLFMSGIEYKSSGYDKDHPNEFWINARSYTTEYNECINEADYAGFNDPFDYQIWNQLSIPKEKKDIFIDAIHELGLDWKLGHVDKNTGKVGLKIFADQSEMEQLYDIVDR